MHLFYLVVKFNFILTFFKKDTKDMKKRDIIQEEGGKTGCDRRREPKGGRRHPPFCRVRCVDDHIKPKTA